MRTVLGAASVALALLYPAIVYYGLTHLQARQLAWLLLPVLALAAAARMPRERRAHSLRALSTPAAMAALIALGALLDDRRFLLAMPVLVNLVLLAGFAGSLRGDMPLVERFARMQVDDLGREEVAYCRHVTVAWSLFFVINGSVAALLAVFAPLSWWALYTGLLAYVLIGLLGATEYVIRKRRFGRWGATPLDRMLRAVLQRGHASG